MSKNLSSKSIANNVLANLAGQFIPILVAVICLPSILAALGVDRLGVLNLAWVIVGYFSILDLGLGRSITFFIANKSHSDDEVKLSQIVWLAIFVIGILGALVSFIAIITAPILVDRVFAVPDQIRSETLDSFVMLGLSIPLVMVSSGLRGVLEGFHQFKIINVVRIPVGIFTYASPLLFIHYSNSLVYPVMMIVIARLVNTLIFFSYARRFLPVCGIKWGSDIKVGLLHLARFGGWMTISNVIGPLMTYMDRFLIGAMLSTAAVAYYSTPYEVVTKLWLIPIALTGVLFPSFAAYQNDVTKTKRLLEGSIRLVIFGIFPATFFLVAFSSEILRLWLGVSFSNASTDVLRWLAFGVFLNCIAQVYSTFLQSTGRSDMTAKFHIFELLFYVPLVVWLTNNFGIVGTSWAWVARVAIDLLLLVLFANSRLLGGVFCAKDMLTLSFLMALMIYFVLFAIGNYQILFSAIIITFFIPLFWRYMLKGEEKAMLVSYLLRRSSAK